jgi:hypothetical protein
MVESELNVAPQPREAIIDGKGIDRCRVRRKPAHVLFNPSPSTASQQQAQHFLATITKPH